jgi:hypothetical protein
MTWQEVLEKQDGVLARHQALAGGMTRHEWSWKVARGGWRLAMPGVAVSHRGGTTERQRAWAAVLHGGRDAVVSGDAALALVGVRFTDLRAIDLAIPAGRRARDAALLGDGPKGVVVHRVDGIEGWTRSMRGLPLATAHVAALHAAAWAACDRDAEWRIAAAVQRKVTAVPLLRGALSEMPRLKRRALVVAVLDDVELGAHAGSELQFLRFCRAHGLPHPDELQVRVRSGTVHYLDARYRRQRVTIEVDGAHHREVATWEADALRTLRVVAALPGEQVIRLTPGLLRHDGDEVARHLRVVLA